MVRQLGLHDCGPAALAMVLQFHGKHVPLEAVRAAVGLGRGGASADRLLSAAKTFGMRGSALQLDGTDVSLLPVAAILHWNHNHFVVLESLDTSAVRIVDPAVGRREVPLGEFVQAFSGVAVVCEPTSEFVKEGRRPNRYRGLFDIVWEQRATLWKALAASLLAQVLSLSVPLLTSLLVDRVVPQRDYSMLTMLALVFSATQCAGAAAGFVRGLVLIKLRTGLEARLTHRFIEHLLKLPYSFFQCHSSGDLLLRLGSNANIRDIITSAAASVFVDGTMAVTYFVILIGSRSPITGMVLFLVAARLAVLSAMRKAQRKLLSDAIETQARIQTYQVELLSGIETLKAMGIERNAAEWWSNAFEQGLAINARRGRSDARFGVLLAVMSTASTLVLMFAGVYYVLQGAWSLGVMLAFNSIASGFLAPVNNVASSALQLQMLEVYFERITEVMESPPERDGAASSLKLPFAGRISAENVSFRYGQSDPVVLSNISLTVAAGSKVALVGRTGSGKSTLARVIGGLYQPESGRVMFGDQDLRSLSVESFRKRLGIVTQDAQLFGGSVRRNIALTDPDMPIERVVAAARSACLHDEILALPLGYETPLADRGLSLSGGQRQRLALARAIAGQPDVLILDEATSHLDARTEREVNRNLESLGCTRVVIAHRVTSVSDADVIAVLDKGRIIESGTHNELLCRSGSYNAMFGDQLGDGPAET